MHSGAEDQPLILYFVFDSILKNWEFDKDILLKFIIWRMHVIQHLR